MPYWRDPYLHMNWIVMCVLGEEPSMTNEICCARVRASVRRLLKQLIRAQITANLAGVMTERRITIELIYCHSP